MKAGREHRVPLSDRCIEILDGLSDREGYLFKKLSSGKLLGDGAFRALMERMGADAYTPHGFRSSFRDWAAENSDEMNDVIELCLGHSVGSKTEAAYKRSDLLLKRSGVMMEWTTFLNDRFNKSVT